MQKILMISAIASVMLVAQETTYATLAEELESKKIKSVKSSSGFTPEISLIMDASYTHQSWDDEGHSDHVGIPGFFHGGGDAHDGHGHSLVGGEEGFSLNYAELVIGASVDSYFDLKGVFHLTQDEFEVEEAFVTTRALPNNLQLKLGKFKSDFGYLNNKHRHNYNFYETPLAYDVFFGDHGLNEQGVQLQYVLPVDTYIMVGVEALKGENERSFGHEGFAPHEAAVDFSGVEESTFPSLWLGYVKTSFEVGGGTLLTGISAAQGDARMNHLEDEEEPHALGGETTLYGADVTYKYYFAADHALSFQSEYIYREIDGTEYVQNGTEDDWDAQEIIKQEQEAFYTELIYQYDRNWRTGVRYSSITQNDITIDAIAQNEPDDMSVTSVMLEYNPSEFSRIRLQYNHNSALYDEDGDKNNKDEIVLQFNYAIGAHGAHAF